MFPPISSLQTLLGNGGEAPMATPALPNLPPTAPMPQPRQGGGIRDLLMQMAPVVLSAFTARKNPRGSAAILQGVISGQQAAAREEMARINQREEKRAAIAKFMQQVASDANQFETPEEVAQYLDFAETIARQIDPSMPAGTLRRTVPVSSTRMANAQAEKSRTQAAKKVAELKQLYGENFDTVAESAAVTFNGKETPVKALLALAELNLTKDGTQVSTKKPEPVAKPENLSEFEGYLDAFAREQGKTRGQLTAAEYEQARKRYQQADDRPVDPTTQALKQLALQAAQDRAANKPALPPATQRRVDMKSRAFEALPAVKRVQTMAESVSFANSLNPQTKNPADDQALIYAFAKAMDPDSVVREGEYATVQKYAQSWAERFGFDVKRVFSNTAFLTPQARANMKSTIQQKFSASKGQYDNLRRSYASQINRITGALDGDTYLTDYGGAFPETAPPPSASSSAPKVGDIKYRADGTKVRITGFTPDGKPIGQVVR